MRINPLLKWFGSKWTATRSGRYPRPRGRIYEPFAGSASYSCNYADREVFIYDTDVLLAELWQWLIGPASTSDVLAIPVDVPAGVDIRMLGLNRGQELLMKHWQRTNNVGDCWTVSAWNGKPGLWSVNTRARVADEINAVKHWTWGPPPTADNLTMFVDPPYEGNYRYSKLNAPLDFAALGDECRGEAARGIHMIVCEAVGKDGRRPEWLPFRDSHAQVTSRRKASQSHHSQELIWTAND